MELTPPKLCLIVPCYNEEKRLDADQFGKYPEITFILVNDGSKDGTLALLNSLKSQHVLVLNLEKNSGKAEAIRQGMLYAQTLANFSEFDWLGFWDGDLSTPIWEAPNFLKYLETYSNVQEIHSVWGSRVYRLGSKIIRTLKRHVIGRCFAVVSTYLLEVNTYDSQCGSKLFRREVVRKAFERPFLSRWIFDLELLLRIGEEHVVEYPLRYWIDIGGSKMRIWAEFHRVWIDLLAIKREYHR